jgi:hypothetical protein
MCRPYGRRLRLPSAASPYFAKGHAVSPFVLAELDCLLATRVGATARRATDTL